MITAVLGITWYGLATKSAGPAMGAGIVRFLLLVGIVVVWLDEHWLDADIKVVIPALLLFLLDRALTAEIAKPYGDYPRTAVHWLGVGWVAVTLAIAFAINAVFARRAAKAKEAEETEGDDAATGPGGAAAQQ